MCRIFGFRSVLQSRVHRSLVEADNAMAQQSQNHPDGWGVAYYKMGSPHLMKMDRQAKDCNIFQQVSGVVSSSTVLTHIRLSTVGGGGPLNTHPFQFGPWVFCHNGTIRDFAANKAALLQRIDEDLRMFIFGSTDSEVLFYLFLTVARRHGKLQNFKGNLEVLRNVMREFVGTVTDITGALVPVVRETNKNYMTFVVTNGDLMLGFHGGQPLVFSTHKRRCSEREICAKFTTSCETQSRVGQRVQHLLLSSEVIDGENIWQPLGFGEFLGVDEQMQVFRGGV